MKESLDGQRKVENVREKNTEQLERQEREREGEGDRVLMKSSSHKREESNQRT
ncbi:UNVERIFIED_CONTAM: hypothetical protein FKN15_048509 [Acipenser sinensis]